MRDLRSPNVGAQPVAPSPIGRLWLLLLVSCALGLLAMLAGSRIIRAQDTPPVVVQKLASAEFATIGDTVTYSITIQNKEDIVLDLSMSDPLPEDVELGARTIEASTGEASYSDANRAVVWAGTLKPEETATIRFEVILIDVPTVQLKCIGEIINKVTVKAEQLPNFQGQAQIAIKRICPDLGDAPDSSNHPVAGMTAYPGPVAARYPTVFDPATGAPPGPRHARPKADAWLGKEVSGERDADLLPDEDGPANLDPVADVANRDLKDDGLLKLPQKVHCQLTTMDVQVTIVGGARERYLNAWIDWNRNGAWRDIFQCPSTGGVPAINTDWVVQNHIIGLGNGVHTITVPAFLAVDLPNTPDDHWLRLTLSEAPVPIDTSISLADGRGPPNGFRFGETEDYRVDLTTQGEPKLSIKKSADVTTTVPGGIIEYTIVVDNNGTGPATGVTVQDPIPAGATYMPGTLTATAPTTNDSNPAIMQWTGNVPAGGSVTIKFKVVVSPNLQCPSEVVNVAKLLDAAGTEIGRADIFTLVQCPQQHEGGDFGDAPDSQSNHHAAPNTAYAAGPVLGRFPTVWGNTPAAEPSGPKHSQILQYWLGKDETRELDADLLPDADGVTNILNNGANDVADNDKADDGWLNPDVPLLHCRESVLKVRVSAAAVPPAVDRLFLNVWFDGTRDGDWNDVARCPNQESIAFEWIVQDWVINPASIPVGGFIDIAVPTRLVLNDKPDADAWIRFTLSEQPAVLDSSINRADGRGPAFPSMLKYGETEDYYRKGQQPGQPGKIEISKSYVAPNPASVGDVITYSVIITHAGGTTPASAVMTDVLPAGVSLIGAPLVTEVNPSVTPLLATYNPSIGPSGAILWNGTLTPNAVVRFDFRVRLIECVDIVVNRAIVVIPNGQSAFAEVKTPVECQPVDPKIELTKSVLVNANGTPVTDAEVLPGMTAIYYLTLSNTDGLTHTVHISDDLPSGVTAVSVSSSSGIAAIINGGQTVTWNGLLGPGTSPVTIKIEVKIGQVECGQPLVNIAKWTVGNRNGQSNPVTLRYACRDLGDAPDSTNHAGVAMTAYPSVQANFPTVFNVAAPERGPRHDQPRPFFLGKRVSPELEADLGFDADGVTNLDPANNVADRDRYDDGLDLASVNFQHCRISTLRVLVTITPQALALLPNGTGYINAWVDSNRDGDWADRFDCPQSADGTPSIAYEHIVIDQPVAANLLGPGQHVVILTTTGPVHWLAELAQRPAWLRVTLSERPSNKPFTTHGDGRGYDIPFRTGETEDYLLKGNVVDPTADPAVTKHGEIWPDFDPATQQRRWVIGWVVNYNNGGSSAANDVHVIDSFAAPQTLIAEHSIPFYAPSISGNTLDYNVGTLPAGGSGLVILRTSIPWTTPPGTVISNSAVISSSNDGNNLNNSTVATVTVPILPPVIVGPAAGSTCTGTVTIEGWVQPGAVVDIYIDGVPVATDISTDTHGNGQGDWSYVVNLPDGPHDIYTVARAGAVTSDPSPTVHIIVDSTLFWDPISLRFEDESGHIIIPSGRLDETGWQIFLRPGHTYTVSLRVCCSDPNAQVTLEIGDDIQVELTDPDNDRIYTGTFSVEQGGRLTGAVRICVTCNLIRRCSDGTVLIDPEGTVYDVTTGMPIDAALVSCMQSTTSAAGGDEVFVLWPAVQFDQVNPQTVATDGYFSFFTPAGVFRLDVEKAGYQPYTSPDLTVVDAPVHFDVPLTPLVAGEAHVQISITDGGFEPSVVTVPLGATIEWINADTSLRSTTSITPSVNYGGPLPSSVTADSGAWDSGLLGPGDTYRRQLQTVGSYTYRDVTNPELTATIIVEEADTNLYLFLPSVEK